MLSSTQSLIELNRFSLKVVASEKLYSRSQFDVHQLQLSTLHPRKLCKFQNIKQNTTHAHLSRIAYFLPPPIADRQHSARELQGKFSSLHNRSKLAVISSLSEEKQSIMHVICPSQVNEKNAARMLTGRSHICTRAPFSIMHSPMKKGRIRLEWPNWQKMNICSRTHDTEAAMGRRAFSFHSNLWIPAELSNHFKMPECKWTVDMESHRLAVARAKVSEGNVNFSESVRFVSSGLCRIAFLTAPTGTPKILFRLARSSEGKPPHADNSEKCFGQGEKERQTM